MRFFSHICIQNNHLWASGYYIHFSLISYIMKIGRPSSFLPCGDAATIVEVKYAERTKCAWRHGHNLGPDHERQGCQVKINHLRRGTIPAFLPFTALILTSKQYWFLFARQKAATVFHCTCFNPLEFFCNSNLVAEKSTRSLKEKGRKSKI